MSICSNFVKKLNIQQNYQIIMFGIINFNNPKLVDLSEKNDI